MVVSNQYTIPANGASVIKVAEASGKTLVKVLIPSGVMIGGDNSITTSSGFFYSAEVVDEFILCDGDELWAINSNGSNSTVAVILIN